MLLPAVLLMSLVGDSTIDDAPIVSASLFKNGYAMVVRKIPLTGPGTVTIRKPPTAVLGTLWINGDRGVHISEVTTSTKTAKGSTQLGSIAEVLAASIGKTVTLIGRELTVTGKVVMSNNGLIALDTDTGRQVLSAGLFYQIKGDVTITSPTSTDEKVLLVRVDKAAPGDGVYVMGLESGLSWSPAYAFDISDPKTVHITAKATIVNDLSDLHDLELRFVSGFPNIYFLGEQDPLTTFFSMVSHYASPSPSGAGGYGGSFANQTVARPSDEKDREFLSENFTPTGQGGEQNEDLFFYKQPLTELKKGDRSYKVLFTVDTTYEHVYTWNIGDYVQNDSQYRPPQNDVAEVWHSLKFTNTSDLPWTTGPAITTEKGQIVAQDQLDYTPKKAEGTLKITKALDIKASADEEELGRETKAIPRWNGNYNYEDVKIRGELTLRNLKNQTVKVKITKMVTGTFDHADGSPEVVKKANGLRAVNPRNRVVWTVELKPGEKKVVQYWYSVLING